MVVCLMYTFNKDKGGPYFPEKRAIQSISITVLRHEFCCFMVVVLNFIAPNFITKNRHFFSIGGFSFNRVACRQVCNSGLHEVITFASTICNNSHFHKLIRFYIKFFAIFVLIVTLLLGNAFISLK